MALRILFLTNNKNSLGLYEWLRDRYYVELYSGKLGIDQLKAIKPDVVVSYNYKYIIDPATLKYQGEGMMNLHTSLLPWNRGANPNFWSFIDNTPKGVTIHEINEGLDKGRIICQRECFFEPEKETFVSTYEKLNQMMTELLKEKWEDIVNGIMEPFQQPEGGSYHSIKDLHLLKSQIGFEWSDNISEVLRRYEEYKNR